VGEGATSNSPADGAPSPTPLERRQAQLARRLQQLRKEAGMGQKQLATLLGVSQGRVSQIETARYSLTPETITRLADALGLTAAVRDELTAYLADLQTDVLSLRLATRRGHRANQARVGAAEEAASSIATYHMALVPGLLQTARYARHMLSILLPDLTGVDELVAGRMERQRILYDDSRRFRFLLTEWVLRTRLAPPSVLRGQIDRLVTLADGFPHVEIRVLPVGGVPPKAWAMSSFDLIDDEYVWVELQASEVITRDAGEVARYRATFEGLWDSALAGTPMLALLRDVDAWLAGLPE
jgi:transcriptional regulator with XRE-family HTH domain